MVAPRVSLLLAAVAVAAFCPDRPAWAGGSDGPCLPAAVECVQAPPAKIVVEIPAPEVVFQQAPSAPASPPPQTVIIEKHCGLLHWLFHGKKDKHHDHAPAYRPAAAPAYAPAAAPVMAMPVSYPVAAPMMAAPMFYPQPAYAMPMAMPSYNYPPPQAAPPSCAPYGAAAPPGYGAPPSNQAANAAALKLLQDLLALRSSNTAQAAPPGPGGTPDSATAAAPPASAEATLASRVDDLWKRVDRLERIAVQQDERLKKLEPKPER